MIEVQSLQSSTHGFPTHPLNNFSRRINQISPLHLLNLVKSGERDHVVQSIHLAGSTLNAWKLIDLLFIDDLGDRLLNHNFNLTSFSIEIFFCFHREKSVSIWNGLHKIIEFFFFSFSGVMIWTFTNLLDLVNILDSWDFRPYILDVISLE